MRARLIGALVATALWLPAALVFLAPSDPLGQAIGLAGLVVSPGVGALLAPRAAASRGMGAGTAILFAVLAVAIGPFAFGPFFSLLDGRPGPGEAMVTGFFGLIFLGIPMLILGTNLALLWVAIVRRLIRRAG
jgi:hypothetical protein